MDSSVITTSFYAVDFDKRELRVLIEENSDPEVLEETTSQIFTNPENVGMRVLMRTRDDGGYENISVVMIEEDGQVRPLFI